MLRDFYGFLSHSFVPPDLYGFPGSNAARISTLQTDSPNLFLWLAAGNLTLSDGQAVTTWPDVSGTSNNATESTHSPIFKTNIINGLPVVRFDGVSSKLSLVNDVGQHSTTLIVGALGEAASSETTYSPFICGNVGGNGMRVCGVLSTTNWGTFIGSDLS